MNQALATLPNSPRQSVGGDRAPVIFVAEDDPTLRGLLELSLAKHGYRIRSFEDGKAIQEALEHERPDLAILDLNMPKASGLEVCRAIRQRLQQCDIPVIVMTGSQDVRDRYQCFIEGTDDFLPKPFDTFELEIRVLNRLRRRSAPMEASPDTRFLEVGDLKLDLENSQLHVADRESQLTPSEFAIMKFLMERPDRACSTEKLLVEALGYPPRLGNPDILRTHIRNLRAKIDQGAAHPPRLINIPRIGYLIRPAAGF